MYSLPSTSQMWERFRARMKRGVRHADAFDGADGQLTPPGMY